MTNHVYKIVEVTGSSSESFDKAVQSAITQAGKSVREMRWFEVTDTRGHIEKDRIVHWQVTVKIGFTLEHSINDTH